MLGECPTFDSQSQQNDHIKKLEILRLLSGAVKKGGKAIAMSVMHKKIAGPKHKKSQTTGVILSVVDILGQNRMDTMR